MPVLHIVWFFFLEINQYWYVRLVRVKRSHIYAFFLFKFFFRRRQSNLALSYIQLNFTSSICRIDLYNKSWQIVAFSFLFLLYFNEILSWKLFWILICFTNCNYQLFFFQVILFFISNFFDQKKTLYCWKTFIICFKNFLLQIQYLYY